MVNMSEHRVKISPLAVERLFAIEGESTGQVYGVFDDDNVPCILGFTVTTERGCSGEEERKDKNICSNVYTYDITPNLPANVVILGTFLAYPGGDGSKNWEKEYFMAECKVDLVLLSIDLETNKIETKLRNEGKYEDVSYGIIQDSFWKQILHLHVTGKFVMTCGFDHDSIQDGVTHLLKKIDQGLAFQLENTESFILDGDVHYPGMTSKADLNEYIAAMNVDLGSEEASNVRNKEILNFNMFLKCSDSSNPDIAPVIRYVKKSFKCAKIAFSIDALAMVHRKTKLSKLYKILFESVHRNMTLNEECLLKQLESPETSKASLPQIYHFYPQKCNHFVSIAYPKKQGEDELVKTRETFHKILSLPVDIPIFRRAMVYEFSAKSKDQYPVLVNPHEGLNPSGVVGGKVALVQGLYSYHHYMQDGFDDNGWGCAYRSLQTIFSWFRHQGYTRKSIPTHREIQQCLVDIGDKPASFVGSKNWIGSTEVSFVLDTLLGVSSRILSVSSGEDLSMKGGELSHHFATQGTPIMIGGGVLAHTIIGVDYDRKTGALKFLILDPHYAGDEDLTVIQSKGWCGWKGIDFWKKTAFYNMCLPLRPKSV